MPDVHSKEVRSYNMSRIKGKNTKPEIIVRKFLFSMGFRYRINDSKLPGKPDIVLRKYLTVIFVNGCFWHGHEMCRKFVAPKNNSDWWLNKISDNKKRDHKNNLSLKNAGWNVITIWECQLHSSVREETLNNVVRELENAI
jgi:DNA mismatch endonuclease (patch repair protein)